MYPKTGGENGSDNGKNVDRQICEMLRRHDQSGMKLLYDAYYRRLVLWANTFLDDIAVAEDLVQELFIDIWTKKIYLKFRYEVLFAFLRLIVRNRCLNRKNKRGVLYSAWEMEKVSLALEHYDDSHDRIMEVVIREIDSLSPRSREILRAVYLDGMKYREVAEQYGISESTVKTLMSRALDGLRDKLNRH